MAELSVASQPVSHERLSADDSQQRQRFGVLPRLGGHLSRRGVSGVKGGVEHGHGAVRQEIPTHRINAVDPGFTKTDLNGNTGTQTVAEGAEPIVRMAQIGADGPTGSFVNRDGAMSW